MKTGRIEFRIDPTMRRQLHDLAHDSQCAVSEVIRRLIAVEYRRRFESRGSECEEPVAAKPRECAARPPWRAPKSKVLTPEQQAEIHTIEQMIAEQGIDLAGVR
jgi:hypothetical protein